MCVSASLLKAPHIFYKFRSTSASVPNATPTICFLLKRSLKQITDTRTEITIRNPARIGEAMESGINALTAIVSILVAPFERPAPAAKKNSMAQDTAETFPILRQSRNE